MPSKKTTNLRLPADCHPRAKAAAMLVKETFSEFIAKSVEERIERLKKEGKLSL